MKSPSLILPPILNSAPFLIDTLRSITSDGIVTVTISPEVVEYSWAFTVDASEKNVIKRNEIVRIIINLIGRTRQKIRLAGISAGN
jgi:hypothetical protein